MEKNYIIYKIECKDALEDGYVYVGSTCNLATRKYNHKMSCCKETGRDYNQKVYKLIREKGGWENWEMKPVEELKATKTQAHVREQYWIDHFKPVLNGIRACQDAEIRKEIHRTLQQTEESKEYRKKYYQANKERKSEYYKKKYAERKIAKMERYPQLFPK